MKNCHFQIQQYSRCRILIRTQKHIQKTNKNNKSGMMILFEHW